MRIARASTSRPEFAHRPFIRPQVGDRLPELERDTFFLAVQAQLLSIARCLETQRIGGRTRGVRRRTRRQATRGHLKPHGGCDVGQRANLDVPVIHMFMCSRDKVRNGKAAEASGGAPSRVSAALLASSHCWAPNDTYRHHGNVHLCNDVSPHINISASVLRQSLITRRQRSEGVRKAVSCPRRLVRPAERRRDRSIGHST